MKIGCHAVLFKEDIKNKTDEILSQFSSMGADGFEMGSRFFGIKEKSKLLDSLAKNNIELSAMHVGAPFISWEEKFEENTKKVLEVAEFMKDMKNKNVLMSANKEGFKDGADLKKIAIKMGETAKMCKDLGVTLNYHNHDLEFKNNGEIYKYLAEYAPHMNFAFDLGWVYVGGCDPYQIMNEQKDRISYLHLRDAIAVGTRDFLDLGKGVFDLDKMIKACKNTLPEDGWCIVEYETGEPDMQRYRDAMQFLKARI